MFVWIYPHHYLCVLNLVKTALNLQVHNSLLLSTFLLYVFRFVFEFKIKQLSSPVFTLNYTITLNLNKNETKSKYKKEIVSQTFLYFMQANTIVLSHSHGHDFLHRMLLFV